MDCFLLHEGKQNKWIFDDSNEEEDEKVYNDFVLFAENKFELKDVKIFKVTSKDDLTKKESIDGDDDLVNTLYDGIDAGGAPLYFLIEGTSTATNEPKYKITVDLSSCGCDNLLEIKIVKHDINDKTAWQGSFEDLNNDIGLELKDDEWEKKYELFSFVQQQQPILKLEQFIDVFERASKSDGCDDVVSFYVSVT